MCAAELPFICDGFFSKLRLRCRANNKLDLEHGVFLQLFWCKYPASLGIPVRVMVA